MFYKANYKWLLKFLLSSSNGKLKSIFEKKKKEVHMLFPSDIIL